MRRLLLSGIAVALTCCGATISGTVSHYSSGAMRLASITTPPLLSVGAGTPASSDQDPFRITGLAPGASADYLLNIRGDGSNTSAVATAATTSSATLLDTDATNGLRVQVDRCSTLWQQASPSGAAICNGTVTSLLASTALATANGASPTLTATGLASLSGGIDHLRIRFSLPASAPAAYASLTSDPTVSVWGQGTPGVPAGVVATAGDKQVVVSWVAPSGVGSSGYVVSASPSGQSCATSGATSCTITGLTDGSTQSITVTASNSSGSGPASAPVSATPYPAGLLTSSNGLSLWLDGADPSTLLSSSTCSGAVSTGGSVGCWKDKSGVRENFKATGGAQPVLGSLNGLGAIDFTGLSQVLASINGSDTYQTVFLAVAPQTTPTGYDYMFGLAGGDFNIREAGHALSFASPNPNDWSYNTGNPPLDWTNGVQATDPTLGATSVITDVAASPQTLAASVSSSFYGNSPSARGMLGDVGEIIAFRGTLTTTQRQTVEDYLAHKWGPTIAPDPPGTPTATAGTTSAAVSWTPPADNGGSPVTGYTATATPGGATCSTPSATGCTITGLSPGTSYTFSVTATNSVGTGASSSNSTPITLTAPPGAPTNLSATATTTSLTTSWNPPSSNGGAAITAYTATAAPGGASCTGITTNCTISGLSASTTYAITVTATNVAGTGPASLPLNAMTAAPPGAPTSVVAVAGDGQVSVSWTAPLISGTSTTSGYVASALPSGQSCATSGATSCTITGLTDGSTQSITVTASDSFGSGPASAPVSATPYPAGLFSSANGLSLWLDGADPSTLFSSSTCSGPVSAGGSVGCWEDKSGFGENVTASGLSQPQLGSLNGLGAIDFTSVSQVLSSINHSDTYQTVFLAVQPQTTPTGWESFFGSAGQDFNVREAVGSTQFSSPNVNDWAYNTGSPPLDWSNGVQATAPTIGATSVVSDQSASPYRGAASISNSFNGRGMLGDVGEVIAFNGRLTTAQRRTVEDYLAHKWGPTITPDPPGTPTGTAGTASTTVSWTAPSDNGGSTVTGYTATASPGGKACSTSGAVSCTITGLTNGTSYTVSVTATNSVGVGPSSNSSTPITPG